MKSDLSRDTFDGAKHFTRVLMQQGRVTLDADQNEQVAILLHYLWTLAADVIGPYGGPATGGGFTLAPLQDKEGIFTIGEGRYYVDGLLVENNKECVYTSQPDYPLPDDDPLLQTGKQRSLGSFLAYLDVWERHVTPVEDAAIREVALGGPDTCNRAKVVWQLKVAPAASQGGTGRTKATEVKARRTRAEKALAKETDPEAREKIEAEIKAIDAELEKLEGNGRTGCKKALDGIPTVSSGRLAAQLDPGQAPPDPCVMAPDSKYRGAENQLYRVEIHDPGEAGVATFKWSRDNGSLVTAWLSTAGNDLVVANSRGFKAGNWVELSDETLDLQGKPGILVKLTKVEPGLLSMDPASVPANADLDPSKAAFPKVRRWDQVATGDIELVDGAVRVQGPLPSARINWIDLEDGIQVRFTAGDQVTYRTGDYWLIPARVATGTIDWPDLRTPPGESEQPPHGVVHHYAPLGFVTWTGNAWTVDNSCRCEFSPVGQCP
jgi:hypothetical protein